MKTLRLLKQCLSVFLLGLALLSQAQAHLMAAQKGTLNIVGEGDSQGAFLVLSMPISAFDRVDDNGDGKLSDVEFQSHRQAISKRVHQSVLLSNDNKPIPLEGLMMSLVTDEHHDGSTLAKQLVVMGRYKLAPSADSFNFSVDLYGSAKGEGSYEVSVSRKSDGFKQVLALTPEKSSSEIFSAVKLDEVKN